MLLNRDVLHPSSSKAQNPLHEALSTVESYLVKKAYLEFLGGIWPRIRNLLVMKVLRGPGKGQTLNGLIEQSPDSQVREALAALLLAIRNSKYFITDLWWAFLHWLATDQVHPRYPQAGQQECLALKASLSLNELASLKRKAVTTRKTTTSGAEMNALLGKLQPRIRAMCSKKVAFLSRIDPAGFNTEDLVQDMNCLVLRQLYSKDHVYEKASDLTGWLLTCVDNALQNMIHHATAEKRVRFIQDTSGNIAAREFPFDEERDGIQKVRSSSLLEFKDMLRKIQDPRIQKYLQVLLGHEDHPDFWIWFANDQPHLAARNRYQCHEPEAIGPWVQRWLGLGQNDLLHFLATYLPDILKEGERVTRIENMKKGA